MFNFRTVFQPGR